MEPSPAPCGFAAGVGGGTNQALLLSGSGHIDLGVVPELAFPNSVGTVEAWIRIGWTYNPGYNPAIFAARETIPQASPGGASISGKTKGQSLIGMGRTWRRMS